MSTFVPVVSARTPSASWFAELFLALGPEQLAGESAKLPNTPWLIVMNAEDRVCQLWQFNTALQTWARVFVPGHPQIDQPLPAGTRRISLCFDQAERPIVAFEQSETIFVTRWDAVQQEYIQNVSFPGTDPVLMLDAIWHGSIGGSDVLLFHLSVDRTQVLARVQSDIWSTPTVLHTYGEQVILDRVTPLPFRYQLLLSDADGAVLDDVLLSGFYPLHVGDSALVTGSGPTSGVYQEVAVSFAPPPDALAIAGAGPAGGSYGEAVLYLDPPPDTMNVSGAGPTGGVYQPAILYFDPQPDVLAVAGAGPAAGAYELVVIHVPGTEPNELTVTGTGPAGGVYEEA